MRQQLSSTVDRTGNRHCWWCKVRLALFSLTLGSLWLAGPVTAVQAESPRFDTFTTLPNSSGANAVVLGDFNGDGLLDLVIGAQQNHLYLNQGAGRFGEAISFGTVETTSLATGDFNNDGALDLLVTTGGTNAIYLNQGDPTATAPIFAVATPLDQPDGNPAGIEAVVGDFNGDGALDLVIGNRTAPSLLYLNRNDGTATFDTGRPVDDAVLPVSSMAVGDLNGDGALDLVLGLFNAENRIYFNKNDRTGTFAAGLTFGEVTPTLEVAVADLDGDDHLDLVVGNDGESIIYLNNGSGSFPTEAGSCSVLSANVSCFSNLTAVSIAAGDFNGDGALDLVVGHRSIGSPLSSIHYFLNDGTGHVSPDLILTNSPEMDNLALGDVNADGLLDLVAGNSGNLSQLYLNQTGVAFAAAESEPNPSGFAFSTTTGDLNGDGALDLVISQDLFSNFESYRQGQINLGNGEGGFSEAISQFGAPSATNRVVVADMNGDGKLDLVTSGPTAGLLYLNDGLGNFATSVVNCLAPPVLVRCYSNAPTEHLVVGDLDGNGTLDLLATIRLPGPDHYYQPYRYLNQGDGTFTPGEALGPPGNIVDLALGELDSDNDLDLVIAYYQAQAMLYRNNGLGSFTERTTFGDTDFVGSIALGDLDNDGALDLVVGIRSSQNKLYLNDGAGNFAAGVAFGNVENAQSTVLGDLNGDGALDLVSANGSEQRAKPNTFYINDGQGHFAHGVSFGNQWGTATLALADFNSDGALDLVTGMDELYLNHTRLLHGLPNNPAAMTIQRPVVTDEANFYSTPEILSSRIISISYTLTDNEAEPVGQIHAFYSLNGGGQWRPAIAASGTQTTNLSTNAATHIFYWDTFASGFFGQSDNVVVRLEARPSAQQKGVVGTFRYPHLTSYPLHYPYATATTFPFRVRGTQVRVVDGAGQPVPGAQVYRLPAEQNSGARPFSTNTGARYRTNAQGYLQGQGALGLNDQLIALQPISATHAFTLYHTSAAPTATGLALQPVTQAGVQTLTVSAANPLVLFDLDIALEWDARNDDLFLEQLDAALARTSAVFFDVSNGQMALGNVRVHQAREQWVAADVVIYASNSIHPRASMGGVVITATNEIGVGGVISNAYLPGQIRMGPIWDPFGQNQAELTEDWSRALAHELAHYLLFLPDNYLGIRDNLLRITNCKGSFMTNAHDAEGYSEFLPRADWLEDCQQTVAERLTGRTDWETILRFFPWLHAPATAAATPGPSTLPLNVLQINHLPPSQPAVTLPARNYDLRDGDSGQLLTVRQAQAYLFQSRGTHSSLTDDSVIPLGSTGNGSDRIKVRGAAPGDRLCVLAANQTPARLGCRLIAAESGAIQLAPVNDWQPAITVSPITSRTLAITVTQSMPLGKLNVQVLPAYGSPTGTVAITSPWATMQVVDPANPVTFTQIILLDYPAFEGFVRVWVEGNEPGSASGREALTQFFLSAAWGPPQSGFGGTDTRVWGPPQSGFGGADTRAWGANNRSLEAPVASGDGKVTIFNLTELLGETGVASLQTLAGLPQVPLWLTPVGQGYRLAIQADHALTIAFHYLQREAPAGYEYTLNLYYSPDDGATWQRLPTLLDVEDNLAAAQLPVNGQRGAGIYALMATLEMPRLTPGWNQFAYPLPQARPVPGALASIAGAYTTIYHFDPAAQSRWRFYSTAVVQDQPTLAGFVNDLPALTFGQSYWLYATTAITPYLSVGNDQPILAANALNSLGLELPPATIYGSVAVTETASITVGTPIVALIAGKECGQASVDLWQGQLVYKIQVAADTGNGCGAEGRPVTLLLAGKPLNIAIVWDNRRPAAVPLFLGNAEQRLFLPVVHR